MYNLIVENKAGLWNGKPAKFERQRVIQVAEFTNQAIAQELGTLSDGAIRELKSFPTLFAYERIEAADARLGFLKSINSHYGRVEFEYEFYPDLPTIPASRLAELALELDIRDREMNRTHWAVKDVGLPAILASAGVLTKEQATCLSVIPVRAQAVSPTVFSLPNLEIDTELVSVMMPFDASFKQVYAAIQRACTEANLRCLRADDIWRESIVIQEVVNLLFRSSVVVADFSTRNPNVMYETGIAHTLGRPVIPISQSLDDVPFDLRHHRILKYLPNGEGLTSMQATLAERLKTLSQPV